MKIYLSKYIYAKNNKDLKKQKKKEKLLANIDAKIRHVFGNNGMVDGHISFPMKRYGYFKIRHRKNENMVIRIYYFCYENKMILLNACEKPDNYDKESDKRAIDKDLKMTDEYRSKFISNSKLYEKYD